MRGRKEYTGTDRSQHVPAAERTGESGPGCFTMLAWVAIVAACVFGVWVAAYDWYEPRTRLVGGALAAAGYIAWYGRSRWCHSEMAGVAPSALLAVVAGIAWINDNFASVVALLAAFGGLALVVFFLVCSAVVSRPSGLPSRALGVVAALALGLVLPVAGVAISALAVKGTNPYVWQYGRPVVVRLPHKCNYTEERRNGGAPYAASDIRCPDSTWRASEGGARRGKLIIAFTEYDGVTGPPTTTRTQARAVGGKAVTAEVGRIHSLARLGRVPHPWLLLACAPVVGILGLVFVVASYRLGRETGS